MKILPRYRILKSSIALANDNLSKKYIEKLGNLRSDMIVIEPFINNTTPIRHKFLKCHHVVQLSPRAALQNKGCRRCKELAAGRRNKKTHDEFIADLKKDNPTVVCLDQYQDAKTSIQFQCTICKNIWKTTPYHVIGSSRTSCPRCSRTVHNKKSHEHFIADCKEHLNPSVKIVGQYENSKTKIECECLICHKPFYMTPEGLLKGYGHQKCSNIALGKKRTKSHEQFKNELLAINPNIVLTSTYFGTHKKIGCHCKACGHNWNAMPSNLTKAGCPKCGNVKSGLFHKYTDDTFSQKLRDSSVGSTLCGDYLGIFEKTKFKCLICGCVYEAIPHHVITGHTNCPECNLSKGERKIYNFLKDNKINFEYEKKFSSLVGVNGGELSYDFYLPTYGKLIEYQGSQHERPIEYFGGDSYFKIQIEHDKKKREYARDNCIDLIEIWYYDYERIEEILIKELELETAETAG